MVAEGTERERERERETGTETVDKEEEEQKQRTETETETETGTERSGIWTPQHNAALQDAAKLLGNYRHLVVDQQQWRNHIRESHAGRGGSV